MVNILVWIWTLNTMPMELSSMWCWWVSSVQFSCSVVSDTLRPHRLQYTRLPGTSPTSKFELAQTHVHWGSYTLQSSHPMSSPPPPTFNFSPASASSPVSQFFASGGQSIRVSASASVLPMNIQDWFPWGLTGLIFLQSKGVSRIFSNTTFQKHQFFGTQLSLWSKPHIHTWLLEKP